MNTLNVQDVLAVADNAADAAVAVIESYTQAGNWSVTYKADDSPVTEADVATEKAIKQVLTNYRGDAAFFGEETGLAQQLSAGIASNDDNAKLLWLVDPIDGTKSFIRNMPFFSTQIALQADGELVAGVSCAPAYGERLLAARGHGVTLNGVPVATRNTTSLNDVFLSSGNLGSLAANRDAWQHYGELLQQVRRVRGYGDFCHYHQLCCGQTDLIIESDVNILDIAALTVGVRESGGVITDLAGKAIGIDTTSVLAAATPELHALVLEGFKPYFM